MKDFIILMCSVGAHILSSKGIALLRDNLSQSRQNKMRLCTTKAHGRRKLHIHLRTDNFRIRHQTDPIGTANFF